MSTSINAISISRVNKKIKEKIQTNAISIAIAILSVGCVKTNLRTSLVEKLFGVKRRVESYFESYTTLDKQKQHAEEYGRMAWTSKPILTLIAVVVLWDFHDLLSRLEVYG